MLIDSVARLYDLLNPPTQSAEIFQSESSGHAGTPCHHYAQCKSLFFNL